MKTLKTKRPKDAATLILYRKENHKLYVLMGCRDNRHAFMPNRYVFPGGAVDRSDRFVRPSDELKPNVWDNLSKSCSRARARSLAAAAIRETWEETGLRVACRSSSNNENIAPSWKDFHKTGYAPSFSQLDFVCRAITPPGRPRRFNARFFIAPSKASFGELRGNGELSDLKWISTRDALNLPIPDITSYVLQELSGWINANQPRLHTPLLKRVGKRFEVMTE
tara:strand:+ start:56351 stop:57019 length:669 start_codon:yes stop_codon:yes gene_type:complete